MIAAMKRTDETTHKALVALIEEIVKAPAARNVGSRLESAGFPDATNLVSTFEDVVGKLGTHDEARGQLATLFIELASSPSPTGALKNFLRFQELSGSAGAFLNTIAGGKPLREILAVVFGSSQYMSDIIIRNPGLLYWLIEQATWESEDTVDACRESILEDIAGFRTRESKLNGLRRAHRKLLLRIGVKDLLGLKTIEETTFCLSALADAVVQLSLDLLLGEQTSSTNVLTVVALGKLGGTELNYSSDIDLIYVCDDVSDDNLTVLHKLGRQLTSVLSEVTAEGYLYRVDLRLRPDGNTGPLVNSLTSARIYYEDRGRPWEFQAMLKARVIAGDADVGRRFLEHIDALIGNPSLSYSPIESISLMRTRIRENISSHEQSFNIKLMEGGIRDIEFIVQTLQMLHGQKHPDIRVGNTSTGLERLHAHKLITDVERDTMLSAYRFFRLVEHRLQMMHQLQTHSLPASVDDIAVLSRRVSRGPLGTFDPEEFTAALSNHLNKVRLLSDRFFEGETVDESSLLLLFPDENETVAKTLGKYGMTDTGTALSIVQGLAYGSFPVLVDRQTRGNFQKLLPKLLEDCALTGDPDRTLVNFANVANATRSKGAFYALLSESAASRELFRTLTGTSSLLTQKLTRNIEVLDTLLEDPQSIIDAPIKDEVPWGALDGKPSRDRLESLRRAVRSAIDTRILAAWVLDVERLARAEIDRSATGGFPAVLPGVLTATTRSSLASSFSVLVPDTNGLALIALGSFAVEEPRLSSDVDLLVVVHERDIESVTRKTFTLNQAFAQSGLFKLDFRLRGEGASAPLVQDVASYRKYFSDRLAPWERIAMMKSALWYGDERVGERFFGALQEQLDRPFTAAQIDELVSVRNKIESLVPKNVQALETKRSAGGRYDIDYLSAIGSFLTGESADPGKNTSQRLDVLADAGTLTEKERTDLASALDLYRCVDYLMELQGFGLPNAPAKTERTVNYLGRTLTLLGLGKSYSGANGIVTALDEARTNVRACYNRVIESYRKVNR